jgi:hypothetical protein
MAGYMRVVPRDLFNEGNLLKCLGQLYLKTERFLGQSPRPFLILHTGQEWNIRQDDSDGSIRCGSITVMVRNRAYDHYRPLNSREPWPLWLTRRCVPDADHFRAFTDAGELSEELLTLIEKGA